MAENQPQLGLNSYTSSKKITNNINSNEYLNEKEYKATTQ